MSSSYQKKPFVVSAMSGSPKILDKTDKKSYIFLDKPEIELENSSINHGSKDHNTFDNKKTFANFNKTKYINVSQIPI